MNDNDCVFGVIGLGTMGRNLVLNMASNGFHTAGLDKDPGKAALLQDEAASMPVKAFSAVADFIDSLQRPRAVLMLVPAGPIVDSVIDELTPLLSEGDILIDGGNSHFTDTERRIDTLQAKGLHFFGMGISGGSEGARNGPSLMPGGNPHAYESVRPVLEAISAKVKGEPCVAYIGTGGSGHFVKMVHNGIEYGIMQLIAEAYQFMKTGLKMTDDQIHATFKKWNEGRLNSFLIEITAAIFSFREKDGSDLVLNEIRDQAMSKGTGKWTSQVAMDLQTPITVIDTSVSMRDLSKFKSLRTDLAIVFENGQEKIKGSKEGLLQSLEAALYFSTLIAYAQGMHMLARASAEFNYGLQLKEIAKIWRGGCIIRSSLLEDIHNAYSRNPELPHMLTDPSIQANVKSVLGAAREIVTFAVQSGFTLPAFTAALSYFDTLKNGRMPTNLIQAQRDFFGAHTYQKIGVEGVFHTDWQVK